MNPKIKAILTSWRTWIALGILVAGCYALSREFDIEWVHEYADKMNGVVAFALLTILPLFGFPVSVLHVTAGIRFGIGLGLVLVACSILLQLLASYGLVHWQRKYFEKKFKEVRDEIPPGAHGPVTLFTLLLPGVPYFAKNYVLPVIGVRLRTYLLWCFPIHTLKSVIAVVLGDQSDQLTSGRVALMLCYSVAMLAASWWAFRRIKAKVGDPPKAEDGRK